MFRSIHSRTYSLKALLAVASFFLAWQIDCERASGQSNSGESQITFHLSAPRSSDPVKVTHVFLGDKEIPLDTPVMAAGMWLRNLRIVVQNISPKPVVEGGVSISFPETGDGSASRPISGLQVHLGRYPKTAFIQKDGSDKAIVGMLQPSEVNIPARAEMTFSPMLPDNADLVLSEARSKFSNISKVNLRLDTFYFGDGSKWVSSIFMLAVPPPVVWKIITPAEFFGVSLPNPVN
jgi:hypothetical protein